MARLAAAEADMQALSRGELGVLRLGAYQSVGSRILPVLMRRFLRHSVSGDVRLTEAVGDPELLQLLDRGDLDLAFANQPLPDGDYACRDVLVDPFVLVVDAGSPLGRRARGGSFALADLDGIDVVCLQTCRSTDAVLAELVALEIQPNVVFRSDHNSTVQGLAAAGIGSALIPRLAYDSSDAYTDVIDLSALLPARLISLVWLGSSRLPPIAQAFVDVAVEAGATIVRDEEERLAGRTGTERERVRALPSAEPRLHAVGSETESAVSLTPRAARR